MMERMEELRTRLPLTIRLLGRIVIFVAAMFAMALAFAFAEHFFGVIILDVPTPIA